MAETYNLQDMKLAACELFGRRVKEQRTALRLSQAALSERTGVKPSYISLVENGRANPTLEVMYTLAEALEVTLVQLLG